MNDKFDKKVIEAGDELIDAVREIFPTQTTVDYAKDENGSDKKLYSDKGREFYCCKICSNQNGKNITILIYDEYLMEYMSSGMRRKEELKNDFVYKIKSEYEKFLKHPPKKDQPEIWQMSLDNPTREWQRKTDNNKNC